MKIMNICLEFYESTNSTDEHITEVIILMLEGRNSKANIYQTQQENINNLMEKKLLNIRKNNMVQNGKMNSNIQLYKI